MLYISTNLNLYADDQSKILFILLYLKKGHAIIWAQNYVDVLLISRNLVNLIETFAAFVMKLEASFNDPN